MKTFDKLKIHIRPLETSDEKYFPIAVDILNQTQGRDLFPSDYLAKIVGDATSLAVGAFYEDKIVGVGVAQIIDDFNYYTPFDINITDELSRLKVGSFSTLSICESLQGKGLGQRISQVRFEWLKKNQCSTILGVSWVSGLMNTSNRVFEKMGFKMVKKVENFYRSSSLENPFDCPGCNNAPCSCSAVLYRMDF